MNSKKLIWAVGIAIEGREFLKYKWESEYGHTYSADLRKQRVQDISDELSKLREIRNSLKESCKLA